MLTLFAAIHAFAAAEPDYRHLAVRAAIEYGVDPLLVLSIGEQESEHRNLRPTRNRPEVGPMQILPSTWQMMRCGGDIRVPLDNYRCGARYLLFQLKRHRGPVCRAIEAYRSGTYRIWKCPGKGSYSEAVIMRRQRALMSLLVHGPKMRMAKR